MPVLLFILAFSPLFATVSGQVLDREGQPLANATVTYTMLGIIEREMTKADIGRADTAKMLERGGPTFTIKTNKKGAFTITGVEYGVYEIEITGPDGAHVYSGKKIVGDPADQNSQNVLNVDLSTVYRGPAEPGEATNLASGKKSKEQLELVRQENAHAARLNRLIVRYHALVGAQDWLGAIAALKELISLDTQRWEFYQNLGTLQANQMQYADAAKSYAQGVEVARKTLANASDSDRALAKIGEMLLAEADCYDHLGSADQSAALYEQAAATFPHPFMAHYRECNMLSNNGRTDEAIAKCNQAIVDDPAQWEPYQLLGGIFSAANRPKDAIETYTRGITAARQELDLHADAMRAKVGLGQMLNAQGNLLVEQKKYEDAVPVFTQAAETSAYPAMPYFNLCATQYNLKRLEDALAACEHALASDPRMADAYYIKAVILFGKGKAENGRFVAPADTAEALNKYLEYDPQGSRAAAVREMLNQLNQPVRTTYAPAKK
jgi:tetratricopeptide (TPR) repeat protein